MLLASKGRLPELHSRLSAHTHQCLRAAVEAEGLKRFGPLAERQAGSVQAANGTASWQGVGFAQGLACKSGVGRSRSSADVSESRLLGMDRRSALRPASTALPHAARGVGSSPRASSAPLSRSVWALQSYRRPPKRLNCGLGGARGRVVRCATSFASGTVLFRTAGQRRSRLPSCS